MAPGAMLHSVSLNPLSTSQFDLQELCGCCVLETMLFLLLQDWCFCLRIDAAFRITVDVPNLVTYLNWTPIFKWYVV